MKEMRDRKMGRSQAKEATEVRTNDALDSVSCGFDDRFEVKNWRYHLTNQHF